MDDHSIGPQLLFFQHIRNNLAPHLSLVDEVADLLNISIDSAYRRIRGEKSMDFEEIQKLSTHFKISLDRLLHLNNSSDSFVFSGMLHQNSLEFFKHWLNDVLAKATYISSFQKRHLYFNAKDMPFMSFYQIPELVTFKSFVWMKTFLHLEALRSKKISLKNNNPEYEELGAKINQVLNQIPTTELWNHVCLVATLSQIEFYAESNLFESKDDIAVVYDKLEELIRHYEKMAEAGKRFGIGEVPRSDLPEYNLFLNELFIGNNTWVAELNGNRIAILNHSVLHILVTNDERFSNYTFGEMENVIRKSTQISTVGEKNRSKFFHGLYQNID